MTIVKGYKAFNKDLKCRDVQFEVGKTYHLTSEIKLCKNGYHFCISPADVYEYYGFNTETRMCEIEASGDVKTGGNKSCTSDLKIVRELNRNEILELVNIGKSNTGLKNSGNYNSGNSNSGNYNSGNYNSGNYNSGHSNSGNYNSGYSNSGYSNSGHSNSGNYNSGNYNSGHSNSGHSNSGNYNSGNYNSGYYNSGNYNSGILNSNTPKVRMFNKDTEIEFDSDIMIRFRNLPTIPKLQYVSSSNMTDQEKLDNKSHETTGGFLRNDGKTSWCKLTQDDWSFVSSLPNFTPELFKAATGEDFGGKTTVTVNVNGKDVEVSKEVAKQLGVV